MWLFLYNIHIEWHSFREARDEIYLDKAVKISVKEYAPPKPYLLMTALHVAVALSPSGTRKWGPSHRLSQVISYLHFDSCKNKTVETPTLVNKGQVLKRKLLIITMDKHL